MKTKGAGNLKITIPIMILILAGVIVIKAAGLIGDQSGLRMGFSGNTTFHRYNGTYSRITGSFEHILFPSSGADAVLCSVTTKSGELTVRIEDYKTKTVLFEKTISGDEEFEVPASKTVRIYLDTDDHRGSYGFKY
ncbi:MAG: hypothetical protein K6G60_01710 [Lachnospiraceae bacterium]|nr:hypothetical protein [Lachnospiraceae bacterium]